MMKEWIKADNFGYERNRRRSSNALKHIAQKAGSRLALGPAVN